MASTEILCSIPVMNGLLYRALTMECVEGTGLYEPFKTCDAGSSTLLTSPILWFTGYLAHTTIFHLLSPRRAVNQEDYSTPNKSLILVVLVRRVNLACWFPRCVCLESYKIARFGLLKKIVE